MTGAFSMASTKQNVHDIIHATSNACAEIDRGSAHMSDSKSEAVMPIQTKMIMNIASEHGIEITSAAAADLLLKFSEIARSRNVQLPSSRQALVGWQPGIDDVNDDSIAATTTETIGWAANSHFEQIKQK